MNLFNLFVQLAAIYSKNLANGPPPSISQPLLFMGKTSTPNHAANPLFVHITALETGCYTIIAL